MTEVIDILNSIGYTDLSRMGEEVRCKPLYRDSGNKTSLAINLRNGTWYDHSECIGGGLALLIQKTLQLPSLNDVKPYLKDLPISIYDGETTELTQTKKFDKTLLTKLVKNHDYWLKRGISEATISFFQGGLANSARMKGRYVIPIFEGEDLIGFAGRAVEENDIKWKILGAKKEFVFPQFTQYIKQNNSVLLVESIGDQLQLWENGIKNVLVLFGVNISSKIIQHLLKLDIGKIIIATNNDFENNFVGNRAAEDIKEELLNYFDESQVVIALPTKNDFGAMNPAEILEWKNKYL